MNKAGGGDGITAEIFIILKVDAVKLLHSKFGNQRSQDWEGSVFIPIPKKVNAKNVRTTAQLFSFHMLAR